MPASAAMSSQEDIVHNLSSLDTNARLKALREVKNQIIGNKTKKLSYIKLGAVRRVVEILASDTDTPLLVQSAAAVGSFACGMDVGVMAILESGGLPHVLNTLSNTDAKVVEAGARSLKMIFQSPLAPKDDVFQRQTLNQVLELLDNEKDNVAEVAASLLARCCESKEQQHLLGKAGTMNRLISMIDGPKSSPTKIEAALDALAALTRENQEQCRALLQAGGGRVLGEICKLIRHQLPCTRLHACMCLVNVFRSCSGAYLKPREIRLSILCVLLKLVDEQGRVGEEAPGVLAQFLGDSEPLQREVRDLQKEVVCEKDGVNMLAAYFRNGFSSARHKENVLNALAQLCSNLEEGRRQLIDLKVFDLIVAALEDSSVGVRAAAGACIQSLSRSVKILRITFKDKRIFFAVLKLLGEPSTPVQIAASGAICNIVLEFSDLKTVVLDGHSQILGQVVGLARSMHPILRLHGVWALKNLLYNADGIEKEAVMRELSYQTLTSLINDDEIGVQIQALMLVRNLAHGKPEDIDNILIYEDGILFRAVEEKLCTSTSPDIWVEALYVIINMAAGTECQKNCILNSRVPLILQRFLGPHMSPQLRLASACCVFNLSYVEETSDTEKLCVNLNYMESSETVRPLQRLRELGFEAYLRPMVEDPCLDIREKVTRTLGHFALSL